MGPSPPLWLLHAKQRLLDQNYKSLWVPDLICGFVHSQQRHYDQSLWVPDLSCRFVHEKRRELHKNYQSPWVSDHTCRFVHAKQRD